MPAGLTLTHRTRRCLIDDISATGVRLRVDEPVKRGQVAMLQFHQLRLFGTVMWCRNGTCGLHFDRKLPQEDMEGFLWIVQNPKAYARICRESGANDWAQGLGA